MNIASYIIPIFIIFVIIFAAIKKVKIYDSFTSGVKEAFPLVLSIFPYIVAILIMTALFETSGLSDLIIGFLSPVMKFFGIPEELTKLILLKPFSGSGSLALLNEIFVSYGADSYVSRTACVVFGSSETIFYVAAVYFSRCEKKRFTAAIVISLASSFVATVFAAFICRVL